MDVVVYHQGCPDGMAAAAVAYHYYQNQPENHLVLWGSDLTEFFVLETINILSRRYPQETSVKWFDISFSSQNFAALLNKFPTAQVWDHHVTGCPTHRQLVLDNAHCGAFLAWKHYFP